MEKLGLKKPGGWTIIKQLDSEPAYKFELHDGIRQVIKLVPTADPLVATMTVKKASLYKIFVLLHVDQGNRYFKLYASIFALIFLVMLITGYLLAWKLKPNRKQLLISSTASVLLFMAVLVIQ